MSTELRLKQVAKELNVGVSTIVEFLGKKGYKDISNNPNTKIDAKQYELLQKEYASDQMAKKLSEKEAEKEKERRKAINAETRAKSNNQNPQISQNNQNSQNSVEKKEIQVVGKIDLDAKNNNKSQNQINNSNSNVIKSSQEHNDQPKVIGKINLDDINTKVRPEKKSAQEKNQQRNQQNNYQQNNNQQNNHNNDQKRQNSKPQVENVDKDKNDSDTNNSTTVEQPQTTNQEIFRPKTDTLPGPVVLGKIEITEEQKQKDGKRVRKHSKHERVDINAVGKNVSAKNDKKDSHKDKNDKQNKFKDRDNRDKQEPKNRESKDKPRFDNNNNGNVKKGNDKNPRNKDRERGKEKDYSDSIDSRSIKKNINEFSSRPTHGKSQTSIHNRERRDKHREQINQDIEKAEKESKILKVTEFVTANELATMMNVSVAKVMEYCEALGKPVNINQSLDTDLISIIAPEFNYEVEFVNVDEDLDEEPDNPEDIKPRAPIVTVMGHVDHGKTMLLDYIRKTNVVAGEAGGITQKIGAYNVELPNGQHITFLDTPGHQAFTAMRARGTKITDIAVIVIAADDTIMPTTEEAIAHAKAANVPIIFAINKIDKPTANPDKIKEALAQKNILVEDWGGSYGSVEISAKAGINIDKLLERILLEAEMLELKANYKKPASGSVIESSLDVGRGYTVTLLVDTGILKVGDVLWAGSNSGKVKAIFNERGKKITSVKPGEPAVVLGLDGAPQAGEKFRVMPDERTARSKALWRKQIDREIISRTKRHVILSDLFNKIKELKVIIKGDVQGSLEAIQDSLEKLSNDEVKVTAIYKGVGQISESDVMLATASNAIIIGFQVRPSASAKKLAEKEQIEIKLYSVIYDIVNEVKEAMEGMLGTTTKEEFSGTAEIKEVFKISKVGNIAGCLVTEGKIMRTNKCRVIRDGIVVYTGKLGSLKRFKDDAKEVAMGTECGLSIENYNDLKVGDIIESFEEKQVQRTLEEDR